MIKKNKKVNKKITIDDLAVMVANGFESIEARMATKEDLKVVATDLKNLETRLSGKIEGINNRIDDMYLNTVKYAEFNALKKRVDILEKA